MRRLLPWGMLVAAVWPVWPWYSPRAVGSPDAYLGLVALAAALIWIGTGRGPASASTVTRPAPLTMTAALLALYALTWPWAPELVRAALALLAVASGASALRWGRRLHPALAGFVLLALPAMPSLQFYVGYPLRRGATLLAAGLLRTAGLAVEAEGAVLRWDERLIAVDTPCSGLAMLLTTGFLVCAIAALRGLDSPATWRLGLASLGVVLAANVLRASALFLLEADLVPGELRAAPLHEGVGLVVFAGVALATCALARPSAPPAATARGTRPGAPQGPGGRIAFGIMACLAALAPLAAPSGGTRQEVPFPGWPASFAGRPLEALPLSAREAAFVERFPGRVGRFTDGRRELVLRWIARPGRRVHPAGHCLRSHGWKITDPALASGPEGGSWSVFRARRAGETLEVRERLHDAAGRTWSDVSSWYWAAILGRSAGPWWHVVIAAPAAPDAAPPRGG